MQYTKNQPLTLVGKQTGQTVIFKSESHKLHQAFPVKKGEVIVQGAPVKLNMDGTIENYLGTGTFVGIAVTDSVYPAYPEDANGLVEVTVSVIGYMIVYGVANGALDAGPVLPAASPRDEDLYVSYKSDSAEVHPAFISLDKAEAEGDLIQILVR